MISVHKARSLLLQNVSPLPVEKIPVMKSCGFILAGEVRAPMNLPPFTNAAMDGFAIECSHARPPGGWKITGEAKAGSGVAGNVHRGETVRIFTGAPIPAGADTVIPIENIRRKGNYIYTVGSFRRGDHVRKQGSDVREGTLVFSPRTKITPAAIALLSALGIMEIPVFRKPRVSVIVTGAELREPGQPLVPGKIYDSSSSMLHALLGSLNLPVNCLRTSDAPEEILRQVKKAMRTSEVILTCGGISEGKYDYVRRILQRLNVRTLFHGVAQKPGKPLYAGRYRRKIILGLPGNPAATFVCFYEYALPVLRRCMGYPEGKCGLPVKIFPNGASRRKKKGRTHFLRARIRKGKVFSLPGQDSFRLRSLPETEALLVFPEGSTALATGSRARVHLLYENENLFSR